MAEQKSTTDPFVLNIQYHTIQGEFVQTTDARSLHGRLGIETKFWDWITRRIEEYGFVREVDYLILLKNELNAPVGRAARIYILTLDMAKELCMLERTELGRRARQYFIQCERMLYGGGIIQRLETLEERLLGLEAGGTLRESQQPRLPAPSPHLPPPPRYPMQEKPHVSEHLIAVWTTLRQADGPLSNAEIMVANRMKEAVTRKWTRYLVHHGLVDLYETAPRHLFMIAAQTDTRATGYFQRLDRIAQIMEQRQRRLFA